MISITLTRRAADKRILSFAVEGHAEYAKPGKDIVCAGVSAVTVGTVNSIEALTGLELPASMRNGWLQSDIPSTGVEASDDKVQLLLESMVVMLQTISESYGKYVVISEQSV
ncbi:ribosomal-processing cysteine protease Prp [Paenibacillus sambharensis]|uniref:Ribosomal processing cysteine protease Prp n=1 Tax=Paenibacillus sambharensis TaxID=1803190 RepID=A0A2W1L5E1_9BACL|nr:ribosomal-processing cysteine protease Prp [Paenibacillus sambharensis]PZD94129.1 ribosomal-processing cysteine protease Prp [Paenibacillus sambharensis]